MLIKGVPMGSTAHHAAIARFKFCLGFRESSGSPGRAIQRWPTFRPISRSSPISSRRGRDRQVVVAVQPDAHCRPVSVQPARAPDEKERGASLNTAGSNTPLVSMSICVAFAMGNLDEPYQLFPDIRDHGAREIDACHDDGEVEQRRVPSPDARRTLNSSRTDGACPPKEIVRA